MKTFKRLTGCVLMAVMLLCLDKAPVCAQERNSLQTVSDRVAKKEFIFTAISASPLSGKQRTLTTEYTVIVTADSIISSLPYFGKAFTAPINTDEAGIMFTSTQFEYASSAGKKIAGMWISPSKTKKTPVSLILKFIKTALCGLM